jgi:hypothetical protein
VSACLQLWESQFPELRAPADKATNDKLGAIMFDQIVFDDRGNFFVEQPLTGYELGVNGPKAICRGNDQKKTIDFVAWNYQVRRPSADMKWTFE